ncbi:MAG: SsrA-binding protein SmpB [Rickettsiales bacterium]|jgi:SsrA-binding protein|nr:SsrA-binding protein SmpB [Rickettsiales bacterium]
MTKPVGKSHFISTGVVAENRRARFNYAIGETFEAGLALTGAEVKSLRYGRANISDGYAVPDAKGFAVHNISIGKADGENPFEKRTEKRARRLLLHAKEISRLIGTYTQNRVTIVPLRLYFNNRGVAKLLLGVGTGKQKVDKRRTIREREWQRDKARLMKIKR